MYVAEVKFTATDKQVYDQFEKGPEHAIYSLFAAWCFNGQILNSSTAMILARKKASISMFVNLPDRDALAHHYDNVYVRNAYYKVKEAGLRKPRIQLLSDHPTGEDACRCTDRQGFILLTNCLEQESPLRCATCFHPTPLYQIPHAVTEDFGDVVNWQATYQACDQLWLGSSPRERYGTQQLENMNSRLSKFGITVGKRITELTQKPVYYYLPHYLGKFSVDDTQRRCPSCNGVWFLKQPWHHQFHFRCDACRLLSSEPGHYR